MLAKLRGLLRAPGAGEALVQQLMRGDKDGSGYVTRQGLLAALKVRGRGRRLGWGWGGTITPKCVVD